MVKRIESKEVRYEEQKLLQRYTDWYKSTKSMTSKTKVHVDIKASAHSFKQFTSRLLKLSFSLSMHIYNSDGCHA